MGRPGICNPCCGGSAGSISSSSAGPTTRNFCNACGTGTTPYAWEVTFSGITPSTCVSTHCNLFNHKFLLVPFGTCSWRFLSTNNPNCSAGANNFTLTIALVAQTSPPPRFDLAINAGTIAFYRKIFGVGEPNCTIPQTLNRVSNGTSCSSWPATVSIIPVF